MTVSRGVSSDRETGRNYLFFDSTSSRELGKVKFTAGGAAENVNGSRLRRDRDGCFCAAELHSLDGHASRRKVSVSETFLEQEMYLPIGRGSSRPSVKVVLLYDEPILRGIGNLIAVVSNL
jgi:hypothetical protein